MSLIHQNYLQEILIPPGVINPNKTIIIELPKEVSNTTANNGIINKTTKRNRKLNRSLPNILLQHLANKEQLETYQLNADLEVFQEARRHYLLKSTKDAGQYLEQLKNQVESLEKKLSENKIKADNVRKEEIRPNTVYVIRRLPHDHTVFIYIITDVDRKDRIRE